MKIKNFFEFSNSINEQFSLKTSEKVLELILKYLNSKLGTLYQLPGFETIKKQSGEILYGVHYIDNEGNSIRFNWDIKGKDSTEIHSIDFFAPENMFSDPDVTLFLFGESIAKILPAVVEIFKKRNQNINISKYYIKESFQGFNKLFKGKQDDKPESNSEPKSEPKSEPIAEPIVTKAAKERKKKTKTEETAEKLLDKIEYADPDTIFDDVDAYVDMVVKKIQPSLIICGAPGIGKTYGITKKIKDSGLKSIEPIPLPDDAADIEDNQDAILNAETDGDWVHIKGASTAFGLYMSLFKYKNKLIVYDDCDSIFKDKNAVNLLKGALDSSDKRIISWVSKTTTSKKAEVPQRFEFTGSIIFISNLNAKDLDSAVRNRSFVVDIQLKLSDVLKRIQSILKYIGKDLDVPLSDDAKNRAFRFLEEASKDENNKMEISIRTLINFAKIAQSGVPQWKRLMEIQAKNI
jgi:hypothetical protein